MSMHLCVKCIFVCFSLFFCGLCMAGNGDSLLVSQTYLNKNFEELKRLSKNNLNVTKRWLKDQNAQLLLDLEQKMQKQDSSMQILQSNLDSFQTVNQAGNASLLVQGEKIASLNKESYTQLSQSNQSFGDKVNTYFGLLIGLGIILCIGIIYLMARLLQQERKHSAELQLMQQRIHQSRKYLENNLNVGFAEIVESVEDVQLSLPINEHDWYTSNMEAIQFTKRVAIENSYVWDMQMSELISEEIEKIATPPAPVLLEKTQQKIQNTAPETSNQPVEEIVTVTHIEEVTTHQIIFNLFEEKKVAKSVTMLPNRTIEMNSDTSYTHDISVVKNKTSRIYEEDHYIQFNYIEKKPKEQLSIKQNSKTSIAS